MGKMFAIVGVTNYLIVAFLNAFTDLGHKIIIQNTVFKVYDGQTQIILTTIVNAMILLPFIMMFSPSGFLSDRFAKHSIMQYASLIAIVITLLITLSYYQGWFFVAFGLTFLLALQSAIYSPAKYGYIKELVGEKFITQGNGAVQAVTTVAILSGIVFYSAFFESIVGDKYNNSEDILKHIAPLGWLLVLGSLIEFYSASNLPNKMRKKSKKTFDFKKYTSGYYLYKNMKIITRKPEIIEAVISLSLLWSISQVVLAIFGEYAKSNLGITNAMEVQGVMALSGFGIIAGSFMVSSYSKYYINIGMVAIGALGVSISIGLVAFSSSMITIGFLFLLFGLSSAFVLVPLNSYIQHLSPNVHLGTIIAGNNFLQNIFMMVFLTLTTVFAYMGMNAEILFNIMFFVGIFLSYLVVKRYFMPTAWAMLNVIFSLRYKFVYEGVDNIPLSGGVLLLGNHVSWIDWLILQTPIKKRINFMMDKDIYNYKYFTPILKKAEMIPISPKSFKDAFKEASLRLKNSKVVAIYPEGGITHNGELSKFQKGYELLTKDYDGAIVPYFIDGMFGSVFARYKGDQKRNLFCRREVTIRFLHPISKSTSSEQLQEIIQNMKDES